MSRRSKAGFVVLTGCLLAAACAGKPVLGEPSMEIPVPTAGDYVRLPQSTLVSRRELQFKLAQVQRGAEQLTLLMHLASNGEAFPVAVMSVSQSGDRASVSLQRLPVAAARDDSADLELATWERLYALAIALDPEARFCLADAVQPCNAVTVGHSHTDFLRELARRRQHAGERVARGGQPVVPWSVVSMTPAPAHGADADTVSIRITGEQGPMEGTTVFFNKAPHSSCVAKSGRDGLATCDLVDQHGHEDSHADHDRVPVLAIFPGDVRTDRVLPPTTLVMWPK